MSLCPYCGGEYHGSKYPITLSKRQREIYNAVVSGGPRGIPIKSLISTVYGDSPPKSGWGVIRVNVFEINRKLREHGQRIRGRRDVGYVLIKDNDDEIG